jgi:hypothetical protein
VTLNPLMHGFKALGQFGYYALLQRGAAEQFGGRLVDQLRPHFALAPFFAGFAALSGTRTNRSPG